MTALTAPTIEWPPERPQWLVTVELGLVEGRVECVGLHIAPLAPEQAVTAAGVKALPVGRIVTAARRASAGELQRRAEWAPATTSWGGMDDAKAIRADGQQSQGAYGAVRAVTEGNPLWQMRRREKGAEELQEAAQQVGGQRDRTRGGAPGYGHAHFVEVAEVYRHAWAGGEPPTRRVAEHFSVTKSAAAKQVAKARQLGLLPPTTRGKPSGAERGGDT